MHYSIRVYKFALVLLIILLGGNLYSQDLKSKYFDSRQITKASEKHVRHLSSERFYGRSTLTGHDLLAAHYIDSIFNAIGLKPININPSKSYSQAFTVVETTPLNRVLNVSDRTFNYGVDFISLGPNPPMFKDFQVIFGGLGDWDDLDSLDLYGKALLILSPNLRVAGMKVQEMANSKGCSLVIVANPLNPKQFTSISQQLNETHNSTYYKVADDKTKGASRFFSRFSNPIPQVLVSDELARTLLGENPTEVWKRLTSKGDRKNIPSQISINFDYNYKVDSIRTKNVIGWIPSSTGSQQTILVCAHFDHLAPDDQFWYPGADDNASGIAALIELSKIFTAKTNDGFQSKRNIVFAAFSAEEIGLLGSQHYSLNPLFPNDSTVVVLNFDMLGRMGKQKQRGRTVFISGNNRLEDFRTLLNTIVEEPGVRIDSKSLEDISLFSLSDHYHFMEKGIPAFLITTGLHNDYHQPSDTPEKLSYENMASIIKLMYDTIKHFATSAHPWGEN